jgi:hypothetical protein
MQAHELIVRRLSNFCYDGHRTYEQKDSAMSQSMIENTKPTTRPTAGQPPSASAEARLAAAVEAAYILEARTR